MGTDPENSESQFLVKTSTTGDEYHAAGEPARRRRWIVPTVIGSIVAVAASALLITSPWSASNDQPAESSPRGSAASDDAGSTGAPAPIKNAPPKRLILGDVPTGLNVQWIQDPTNVQPGQDFGGADNQAVLLAKPGANFAEDGWIAVLTRPMDRFERRNFDPTSDGQMESPRKINVGTMSGATGRSFEGFEMLTYGPVNDGYAVTIAGPGLSQLALTDLASLVEVDDDGRPAIRTGPVVEGYEPLGLFRQVWGVGALAEGGQQSMMAVNYGGLEGDSWTAVSNTAQAVDDPLRIARFFLKNPVEGTVHGQPAVAGDIAARQPMPGQPARVTWIEDGYVVTVMANKPADELLALAETVREATDDEWSTMKDDVKKRQEEANLGQNLVDTWIVGAGDLEDSTTWVVEGGYADGRFSSSIMIASADGSSMSGGGGSGGEDITYPYLSVQPNSMGGPFGNSQSVNLVVALVTADTEGAVLRFTPADSAEAVIEVPIHLIRDDWPAFAGALGAPGDLAGTVEIVAIDGTILATKDVEAMESNGDDGGDVTAATVAAAVGG